jgi:hypothetical protein
MNKKLLVWVSVGVVAAILLLLGAIRLTPVGDSEGLPRLIIGTALSLLALPMRLYVIFFLGEDGHWFLPAFVFLLVLSGLMWGVIVERVAHLLSKKRAPG